MKKIMYILLAFLVMLAIMESYTFIKEKVGLVTTISLLAKPFIINDAIVVFPVPKSPKSNILAPGNKFSDMNFPILVNSSRLTFW